MNAWLAKMRRRRHLGRRFLNEFEPSTFFLQSLVFLCFRLIFRHYISLFLLCSRRSQSIQWGARDSGSPKIRQIRSMLGVIFEGILNRRSDLASGMIKHLRRQGRSRFSPAKSAPSAAGQSSGPDAARRRVGSRTVAEMLNSSIYC